jgi:hypothetical protein
VADRRRRDRDRRLALDHGGWRLDDAGVPRPGAVGAIVVRLRADVDLESVRADVVGVLGATFRPTQADVWQLSNVRDRAGNSVS